ncbi:hypothetical protein [Gimibacter soli]|uniref:Uncharacterized protein n=1 Tax=Gimibacter soli TaxID=3024400 RepID=A0AAE9XNB1_9PROT|nr:hypothetical protein [Gimibacter soli]WCL54162.1 hypothetical protein PH603_00125 [Gimibacter soli]
MPTVNLELQLKFLNDLEAALADAMQRFSADGPEKLAELKFMQAEVDHARRIVAARILEDDDRTATKPASKDFGHGAMA